MASERFELLADEQSAGMRLDKWLALQLPELSRSRIEGLIAEGAVTVNGGKASKSMKLRRDDTVTGEIPEPQELTAEPQDIPVEIVYEDEQLLVVNKPKGMVVHPAAGNPDGTLVNALMFHCKGRLSSINGVVRPGIVHRIDKLTSGLLMVAKTDEAHRCLAEQIKEHSFTREYNAIVCGAFAPENGTIDAPIGRSRYDRKKMCVTEQNSKNAVTHYETIERFKGYSWVKFTLETGRTHQIRVHSAYKGHAVLGDDVYGKPYKGIEGQCLHAKKIGFVHPDGRYMEFDSELPQYFQKILEELRK
ncbi:23S rRNA pseudouridine1911/1915/1917 synthase [Ruminococcus sp. YE71]|uniref:RluA family pseudouridine synthase n=1 Tax=unclassified Ruminococcus TaxID=2608920 RepID=UPI00088C6CC2|nr:MULTISPECIES: RluA family pseudouridine synthase [unclassified Ruminococcus]SDA13627.1 23S rRNA pseudouridine1911/1915/1917 synthase [Ruminococcus sp. YE78]SFW19400.1 23S rRNA pseudouridine1911/1915/1917 synthase [Ruminococcus sp. YE71]